MVQLVKALVTKPDNLSLIPRAHLVEGENLLLGWFSDDPMHTVLEKGLHVYTHVCTLSKYKNKFLFFKEMYTQGSVTSVQQVS